MPRFCACPDSIYLGGEQNPPAMPASCTCLACASGKRCLPQHAQDWFLDSQLVIWGLNLPHTFPITQFLTQTFHVWLVSQVSVLEMTEPDPSLPAFPCLLPLIYPIAPPPAFSVGCLPAFVSCVVNVPPYPGRFPELPAILPVGLCLGELGQGVGDCPTAHYLPHPSCHSKGQEQTPAFAFFSAV